MHFSSSDTPHSSSSPHLSLGLSRYSPSILFDCALPAPHRPVPSLTLLLRRAGAERSVEHAKSRPNRCTEEMKRISMPRPHGQIFIEDDVRTIAGHDNDDSTYLESLLRCPYQTCLRMAAQHGQQESALPAATPTKHLTTLLSCTYPRPASF